MLEKLDLQGTVSECGTPARGNTNLARRDVLILRVIEAKPPPDALALGMTPLDAFGLGPPDIFE